VRDRSRRKKVGKRHISDPQDGVVAVVMVVDSPVVIRCLSQLHKVCDGIYVLFDMKNGTPGLLRELRHKAKGIFHGKLRRIVEHRKGWEIGRWHEPCIRILDDVRPGIVITAGHDEMFETERFKSEIRHMWEGGLPALMLNYGPLPTDDGRKIPYTYPAATHMKAFKWRKGLTYIPYNGRGQVNPYADPRIQMTGKSKVRHYCMWTKEMQAEKEQWLRSNYDFGKVTGQI
jgi:hypothetical protein